jgi:hypothetical protein
VPFKANQDRRHRIPKQRHRVTNWAGYDAALRRRGSLTVWFSDEAIAAWRAAPRTTRGGQPHYSALAIGTALALRAVFRPSRCRLRLMADGSGHRLGGMMPAPRRRACSPGRCRSSRFENTA